MNTEKGLLMLSVTILGETLLCLDECHYLRLRSFPFKTLFSTAASTPWFDAYRDTYLDFLKQSDHETIRHYISGMLNMQGSKDNPVLIHTITCGYCATLSPTPFSPLNPSCSGFSGTQYL